MRHCNVSAGTLCSILSTRLEEGCHGLGQGCGIPCVRKLGQVLLGEQKVTGRFTFNILEDSDTKFREFRQWSDGIGLRQMNHRRGWRKFGFFSHKVSCHHREDTTWKIIGQIKEKNFLKTETWWSWLQEQGVKLSKMFFQSWHRLNVPNTFLL